MIAHPVLVHTESDTALSPEVAMVRQALIEQGLETPMLENGLSGTQKYTRIKSLMTDVVSTLGLDLSDDSLAETPHRIAKMYVEEIFVGLDYASFPKLSLIENKFGASELLHAVDYLLESSYVTGRILPLDGGRHLAA